MITNATAPSAATQTPAPTAASDSNTPEAKAAAAASNFESFLQLLTAQLRNQDPLSPLDSTQFVQQLASFSSVEQQIETNKLLRQIVGGDTQSTLDGATQWIGKEVEAPVSDVQFAGQPMRFRINPSDKGTASEVIVKDAGGNIVYSESLTPGQTEFTWDGSLLSGGTAANGGYTIDAQYTQGGAVTDTEPMTAVAHVTEARLVNGAVNLVLDNGGTVDPSTVTAVRATS
ncbi:MAG: hypothetical protein GC153_13570 [Alphaproteobacteria bacterium]|nr:hypothetical protein [Alphaproteobacteria bacterium]